ncbi:hypothetical protein Pyn_20570 [Prunus yedoensis var. nudiflora]|uniref:Uncharacterized protein n=1 Tax=Prunus yedoensis var. nudiflora TaxID=2094558 RepID=A0A314YMB5_PRUYE|nr:hypothetical protein Pyn_20570 [Prunus yedoensis var. nudiflora]
MSNPKLSTKVADVLGFCTMLKDVLSTLMRSSQPPLWPEMNNFFNCFDKSAGLIRHAFLMDPLGRMNYFIQLTSLSGTDKTTLVQLLFHADFSIFAEWDVRLREFGFLLKLYEYPGLQV